MCVTPPLMLVHTPFSLLDAKCEEITLRKTVGLMLLCRRPFDLAEINLLACEDARTINSSHHETKIREWVL